MQWMTRRGSYSVLILISTVIFLGLIWFGMVTSAVKTITRENTYGALQNALAMAIAKTHRVPTLTEFMYYIHGSDISYYAHKDESGRVLLTGLQVYAGPYSYFAPTFQDPRCLHLTKFLTDPVICLGRLRDVKK